MKASHRTMPDIVRCSMQCALAVTAMLFSACSVLVVHPRPSNATQRNGQVKFTSPGEDIIGEIAIRYDADHFLAEITKGPGVPLLSISAKFGTVKFSRETPASSQTPTKHMLVVHATGPLAHGGFTWRPELNTEQNYSQKKLKAHYRAWSALPEVFMWGEAKAKGETYQVCLPDLIMDFRTRNGEIAGFRYVRLDPYEVRRFLYGVPPSPDEVIGLKDVPQTKKDQKKLLTLALRKPASRKPGLPVLERVECVLDK